MINQVSFTDIKPAWEKAYEHNTLHVPFYTYAWHQDWYEILGGSAEPLCLVIDDEVVALLVKIGNTVMFSGGEEIADYLDLIGPEGKKYTAWEQIVPFLEKQGIKEMVLRNIPENSPTLEFFKNDAHAEVSQEDTT